MVPMPIGDCAGIGLPRPIEHRWASSGRDGDGGVTRRRCRYSELEKELAVASGDWQRWCWPVFWLLSLAKEIAMQR